MPALIEVLKDRAARWDEWQRRASCPDAGAEFCEKWWFADAATIRANDYNLSADRYRPMNQIAIAHRNPRERLDELAAIEVEIAEEVEALKVALGND